MKIPIREHFRRDGKAKVKFLTLGEAEAHARDMNTRHGSNRRPYEAYECGFCGGVHVGRKPPPGKRAKHEVKAVRW